MTERIDAPPPGRKFDRTRLGLFLVLFTVIAIAIVLLWRWPFGSGANVTLSLSAKTQTLTFDLVPERPYLLRLPAGDYYGTHSTNPNDDIELSTSGSSAFELLGSARVTVETGATGQLMLTVGPLEPAEGQSRLRATIRHAGGVTDATEMGQIAFVSTEPVASLRLPLVAGRVVIGQLLTDTTGDLDLAAPYQPILLGGDVRFFARAGAGNHRYLVLEGGIDPGDVVTVGGAGGETKGGEQAAPEIAWMLVTFAANDRPAYMDLLLHVSLRRVLVTRLHAPEGYYFGVTPWLTLSSMPAVQYLWVSFASATLLLGFFMSVTNFFSAQHDDRSAPGRTAPRPPARDDVPPVAVAVEPPPRPVVAPPAARVDSPPQTDLT